MPDAKRYGERDLERDRKALEAIDESQAAAERALKRHQARVRAGMTTETFRFAAPKEEPQKKGPRAVTPAGQSSTATKP